MKPAAATKHDEKEKRDLRHELDGESTESALRAPVSTGAAAGMPAFLQRRLSEAAPAVSANSKFAIGARDDPLEHEADRVADAATSAHAAPRQQPPAPRLPNGAALAQRAPRPDAAVASEVQGRGAGAGEPLNSGVRERAESALGQPLDHVRVHADPGAQQLAGALGARAFTHGNHIWLGKGESPDDVRLMAHEATHVLQQGNAGGQRGTDGRRIQRMPASAVNDGEVVRGKLSAELDKAKRDAEKNGDKDAPPPGEKPKIDPAEKAERKAQLAPKARPPRDRAGEARPRVERAAADTKAEAGKAPQKMKGQDKGVGEKGASKGGPGAAQASAARTAFATAAAVQAPPRPLPVIAPKPVVPVDAGGRPLPADTGSEARVLAIAAAVQQMRMQAAALRARAADERANAQVIRGNIRLAQSHIADSDNSVTTVEGHVAYRRDVQTKGRSALDLSKQKADKVASEAPGFVSKSSDGKDQSGPMASDAANLAGEAGNQQPDDEEAAGDSQEQAGQLSSTSGDLGSIDSAIGQTKTRAEGLEKDAAQAKEKNTHSEKQLDTTDATIEKTDAKLTQMKSQNEAARAKLAGLENGPARQTAGADALDQGAAALLNDSQELEARLHQAQQNHDAGMRAIPASKAQDHRDNAGSAGARPVTVQRVAAGAPEKVDLNLAGRLTDTLPTWLTGEERQTEEQRRQQLQQEQKRRKDEIAEIEASGKHGFSSLTAWDKMGIALSLTGRHLWGGVAGTNWADFGGHLLRGFVDPRVGLLGIVSGLSMTLSGFGTIYKQWDKDRLGAVLTGAAQIANGVTIVLGSITGLALAIMVILTAIAIIGSIFSFGAVGAALAPIIAFCGTVVSTVGGWTIVAAEVALVLNALVFIKDLIDAATATTAADLQTNADAMTEDAKNEGNMALQIGMAKGAEFGAEVIGNTRFGQAVADQWGAVKQGAGLSGPPGAGAPAADAAGGGGGSEAPASTNAAPGAPATTAAGGEPVATATGVAPPPATATDAAAPTPTSGTTQAAPGEPSAPTSTSAAPQPAAGTEAPAPTSGSPTTQPAAPKAPDAHVTPTETAGPAPAKPATTEPTPPPTSKPAAEPPQPAKPSVSEPSASTTSASPKPAATTPGAGEPQVTEPAPAAQGGKPAPAGKGTGGSAGKPAGNAEPVVDTPTKPLPEVEIKNPPEGQAGEAPKADAPSPEEPTQSSGDQATDQAPDQAAKPTEAPSEKPGAQSEKPADQGEKPADQAEKPADEAKPEEKTPEAAKKEAMEKRAEQLKQRREALQKKAQNLWEERNSPSGRDPRNRVSIDVERDQVAYEIKKIKLEEQALDEELHPEKYPTSTNAKGDIGELKGDEHMGKQNYQKIGSSKEPVEGPGQRQGLDGVYENKAPPPKYVVGEAKYGEADLSPEQRTKEWVDARLDQALGKELADKVRLEGYEYWKLHFDPATGVVTPSTILKVGPLTPAGTP